MKEEEHLVSKELMAEMVRLGFNWPCVHQQEGVPRAHPSYLHAWMVEVLGYRLSVIHKNDYTYNVPTNLTTYFNGYVCNRIASLSINKYNSNHGGYSTTGVAVYDNKIAYGRKVHSTYLEAFQEGLLKVIKMVDKEKKEKS